MDKVFQGSCLCGLARYKVEDAFTYALICHCSPCRRATGAGHKPFAGIVREARYAHVTLGALVDEPTIRPTAHIHVASKTSGDVIRDELPQHEAWP